MSTFDAKNPDGTRGHETPRPGGPVRAPRFSIATWIAGGLIGAGALGSLIVFVARCRTIGMPEAESTLSAGGGETTESVLAEQGPDCLECARRHGCFDPQELGGTCEGTKGNAAGCGDGVTETAICLKTLEDMFRSKCVATLQETPCLCGTTDPSACLAGTAPPTGPVFADYECDFGSANILTIQGDFTVQTFGAGQANALVQCAASYDCKCFGHD